MPNPRTKEFPLRHKFGISFTLQEYETSAVNYATIIPFFFADQAKTDALAQNVEVNPNNDNYVGTVSDAGLYMNSRVNKIKITEYCMVPTVADVPDVLYAKAIISWGMGDADIKDVAAVTLLSKLGFQLNADTISADYSGTDMDNAGLLPPDCDGLTTTLILETIDGKTIESLINQRTGTLGPKVKAMMIGPFLNRVHKDFPYFSERWYSVPGRVKRALANTGCFMYVGVNIAKDDSAPAAVENWPAAHFRSDLTIDEESLNCHYLIEFNEYNDAFSQSA